MGYKFLLFFFSLSTLYAAEPSIENVDRMVQTAMEAFQVPGCAVGIIMDGKTVFVKGYGALAIGGSEKVDPSTPFAIGSCTKAFIAYIIQQLVEEGKASWDDPIQKHLPEFALLDKEASTQITLRDLIAHRSGLERHDALWVYQKIRKEELLDHLKHLSPRYSLRSEFQYNNFAYTIAALAIEKITGKSWEEEVKERILLPFEMDQTFCGLSSAQKQGLIATPHATISSNTVCLTHFDPMPIEPAGGIYSSVDDLLKWTKKQICYSPLHTMQMPFKNITLLPNGSVQEGYGLGWYLGKFKAKTWVFHSGSIHGFYSDISMLPEKESGIIILCNNGSSGPYFVNSLRSDLLDWVLNVEGESALPFAQNQHQQAERGVAQALSAFSALYNQQPSDEVLKEYCGVYAHPAYGILTLSFSEGSLTATIGSVVFPIAFKEKNLLVGKSDLLLIYGANPIMEITFIRNANGSIEALDAPFEAFRKAEAIRFLKRCQ